MSPVAAVPGRFLEVLAVSVQVRASALGAGRVPAVTLAKCGATTEESK